MPLLKFFNELVYILCTGLYKTLVNRILENQTKYSISLEKITTALFYFNKICTAAPSIQGYAVQRSFPMTKYSKKRGEGMVLWTLDHSDLCAKVLCNPVSLKKITNSMHLHTVPTFDKCFTSK